MGYLVEGVQLLVMGPYLEQEDVGQGGSSLFPSFPFGLLLDALSHFCQLALLKAHCLVHAAAACCPFEV